MRRRYPSPRIVLIALSLVLAGGCPDANILLTALNTVEVRLINDTSFPVDPNIRYDDDDGWLASLFPAGHLSTGLIGPGDSATFPFDCDELGLIFSDEAEQVIPLVGDYVAEPSKTLERDDEYDCGDVIRFRFVGNAGDFGVVVSVNGRIVD